MLLVRLHELLKYFILKHIIITAWFTHNNCQWRFHLVTLGAIRSWPRLRELHFSLLSQLIPKESFLLSTFVNPFCRPEYLFRFPSLTSLPHKVKYKILTWLLPCKDAVLSVLVRTASTGEKHTEGPWDISLWYCDLTSPQNCNYLFHL